MPSPRVTILTATTGRKELSRCVKSVEAQTYENIEHLVVADGHEFVSNVNEAVFGDRETVPEKVHFLDLPWNTGKDRYNGHRIYGGCTYFARGDYIIYLDDDNYLEPTHVEDCLKAVQLGKTWAFSFRNIVSVDGKFLCQDNCESLGMWPSIIDPRDFFVDVNCYFLPKNIAVTISPVWYCKFREPGQPEIDRKIMHLLRSHFPNYGSTYRYTVNYAVAGTGLSVKPEFFEHGNAAMLQKYNGELPWVKK